MVLRGTCGASEHQHIIPWLVLIDDNLQWLTDRRIVLMVTNPFNVRVKIYVIYSELQRTTVGRSLVCQVCPTCFSCRLMFRSRVGCVLGPCLCFGGLCSNPHVCFTSPVPMLSQTFLSSCSDRKAHVGARHIDAIMAGTFFAYTKRFSWIISAPRCRQTM